MAAFAVSWDFAYGRTCCFQDAISPSPAIIKLLPELEQIISQTHDRGTDQFMTLHDFRHSFLVAQGFCSNDKIS